MLRHVSIGLLATLVGGCDGQALEPCVATKSKPVLEIVSARDQATGAAITALAITDVRLDGFPVDSGVLSTNPLHNVERTMQGLTCTVPCLFGIVGGVYTFRARATGYYPTSGHVLAQYSDVPIGCPLSHGSPTHMALALTEADSARAEFSFAVRAATNLPVDISTVTFDDGSGPRTVAVLYPWQEHVTRNSGTLHVRFVVGAPDTLAVGEMDLPLRKDWRWSVTAFIYDRNPKAESFCIDATSFPLRRPIPGADSLYLGWSGLPISQPGAC